MPGEILRLKRKEAGLTIGQLHDKTGVSVPAISRWERGERKITVDKFTQLLDALGSELVVVPKKGVD